MTEENATHATDVARAYYDTDDIDGFYSQTWGGEDIHVGVYTDPHEAIGSAAGRTVERMAAKVGDALGAGSTVLDMGSGYGGAARRLAGGFDCHVVALNISEVQNARHRELNAERGLDDRIEVVTGSFQDIPAPDGKFDVVWSQEALCHSGDRTGVLREARRVLKPGGHLVFTDLMAAEDAPDDEVRPAAERLRLTDFATAAFYVKQLKELAYADVDFDDLSDHMLTHYERLTEEVLAAAPGLTGAVSAGYVDRLRTSLPQTAAACRKGHFRWGIFHGRRG
ncbi:methyltransferase domain-containing protein [Streptomyces sp. NPDC087300]|uniref:methyltransferase domain-containing protein n=1 Tax=Streptomyces sp. NPDC087300 TaxID=3365780 RepID=UPI00381690E1